jgi:diaminopimelate epimerase
MKIPFTKLHGAKNDFLLTLAGEAPIAGLQEIAIAICNRYTGVGADGWIIADLTPDPDFDAAIRLFNSDGSEPELSGNGTRCAAVILARADPERDAFRIWTAAGVKDIRLISHAEREYLFRMNMGDIRITELHASVQGRDAVLVDCGNPQCAILVDDFDFDWRAAGAAIERDVRFPNRTNVSFLRLTKDAGRHGIEVRFWERGVGETNSSGTGSTGAAMAAAARGMAHSPVIVHTPAGPLEVGFEDGIWLTGPAEYIAYGFYHYGRMGKDE